jgi:hypothetical protein
MGGRSDLAQVSNAQNPEPDWRRGYGFQFWMSQHGYRGDGAFGQFCIVLPEQDAVIVTTAYTLAVQAVLDALWTHLLPGLGSAGSGRTSADVGSVQDKLNARLAGLSLPPGDGAAAPVGWEPWTSRPFAVADPAQSASAPPGPAPATLVTSVEVARSAGGLPPLRRLGRTARRGMGARAGSQSCTARSGQWL